MKKRPHIIIINPDEMRADSMSHLGNPAAVTPNLDQLANVEGVSFAHAYCQNPVCVPSRCSFFTGLYPHDNGHRTMSYLLHPDEPSLFSELRDAGYYVWMNDRNDLYAGQYDGWIESNADEIFIAELDNIPGPVNAGIRGEKGNKWYYSHFRGELLTDETGKNYNQDDAAIDAAIEKIKNPPSDKPMCLFLGLFYPHVPYQVEEPYFSIIDRKLLPKRIQLNECTGKAPIVESISRYSGLEGHLTEDEWDELRATYLGMVTKIDAQYGKLVQAIKETGIYDNCAIFVLSDHGDYTGDYGCPEKAQNSFEECLTRVPFLVKPPKDVDYTPGISGSLVELVDFYATVMDFAGIKPNHTQFGKSIRHLLINHEEAHREYVYCEGGRIAGEICADEYHNYNENIVENMEYWPKVFSQKDDLNHAKGIMMRGKRYKYINRIYGHDELYDLENDPGERTNIIDRPDMAETVAEMKNKMLKWLTETCDTVPNVIDHRWSADMMIRIFGKNIDPVYRNEMISIARKGDIFALMDYVSKHSLKKA